MHLTAKKKNEEWQNAIALARQVNDHYSMYEQQQQIIFDHVLTVPKNGVVVELGVAYGKTSVVMAYACRLVGADFHAVDNFSLVGSAGEYRTRLTQMGLSFELHEGKTQEVPWKQKIDLLVIDAGHDEKNVKADCERWLPWVKPGGVVIFHDYEQGIIPREHPHWGVKFYADKHTKGWKELEHWKQLKVKRRPK